MANKTKKRLLLSKWREKYDRAALDNRVGQLLSGVEQLNLLVGKLTEQDEKIAQLEADLKEAREEIISLEEEFKGRDSDIESVLVDVRYWLHDGLVHGKIVSDPRAMLRKIEDVLG